MSASARRLFVPARVDYPASDADITYADVFAQLAELIDACGNDGGRVTLLLSTCRNQWMTVNAIFVDLREILAASGAKPDMASAAFWALLHEGGSRPGTDGDAPATATRQLRRNLARARGQAAKALELTREVRLKLETWERRDQLLGVFTEKLDQLERPARMQAWYRTQRTGARDGVAPWQHRYLALDPTERDPCTAWLATLRSCERTVTIAMQIARHAADLLMPPAPADERAARRPARETAVTEALFSADVEEPPADVEEETAEHSTPDERAATWDHLVRKLREGAPALAALPLHDADDHITLKFADALTVVLPTQLPDPDTMRELLTALVREAEVSVAYVREKLSRQFQANVAATPLPAPYVIDLTTHEQASGRRVRSFTIKPHMAHAEQGPDSARIALLDCPMPEDAYSHQQRNLFIYDRERLKGAEAATHAALAAVDAAREHDAQLIVMPEVFLPRGVVEEVVERARQHEIGVIAGVEYPQQALGAAVNEAIIALPGLGQDLMQRKQAPSVYEVRQGQFDQDGTLHVIRRTQFGTIAVVICSDYMELDHVWAIVSQEHALDLLVLCSRNPRPEVLNRLAIADAVRLHAYVAVANADPRFDASDDLAAKAYEPTGTIVARPCAHEPLMPLQVVPLPPAPDDGPPARLLVGDLDIATLRSKDLERVKSPFLPPPRFPRWQPPTAGAR